MRARPVHPGLVRRCPASGDERHIQVLTISRCLAPVFFAHKPQAHEQPPGAGLSGHQPACRPDGPEQAESIYKVTEENAAPLPVIYQLTPARQCTLSMIVAMGEDRAIGERGTMPWYLPDDLRRFKALTSRSCVIMGRKTFESIGRPLPARRNIVITSSEALAQRDDIEVATSLPEALDMARDRDLAVKRNKEMDTEGCQVEAAEYDQVFLLGGSRLFREGLSFADRIIITEIRASFPCADTFFPELIEYGYFVLEEQRPFMHGTRSWYFCEAEQPKGFAQEITDFDEEESIVDENDNVREVRNIHTGLAYKYLTYERVS